MTGQTTNKPPTATSQVTPLADAPLADQGGMHGIAAHIDHLLFSHRVWVLTAFLLMSILLGWQASKIELEASFQKMIPASHPYIENYLAYEEDLRKMGNVLRVVVEN